MAEEAAAFEGSDFLKGLRERSEANKEKNKKDIFNKYCQRQAEMGVGDCKQNILPCMPILVHPCLSLTELLVCTSAVLGIA